MIDALLLVIVLFYIWFETDAAPEYLGWTGIAKEYFRQKQDACYQDFPSFLLFKHSGSFWIRLISCPPCLGVWAGIFLTLFDWTWTTLGVNIIGVWLGYAGLRWLLKVFNG